MPAKPNQRTTFGPDVAERNRVYKHSLRKTPYWITLVFLIAATALTLLNIYGTDLIHVKLRNQGPLDFETKYGLYQRCTRKSQTPNSTLLWPSHPLPDPNFKVQARIEENDAPVTDGEGEGWQCQDFPSRSECAEFGEKFCVLWSTSGYSAQLSLLPCALSLLSLLFIFLKRGERTARARARRHAWKLVSGAMLLHCNLQLLEISLVLHVFRTDDRFAAKNTHLDSSFTFGVISAIVSAVAAAMLTFTGLAARRGKSWAAGTSARKSRRHKRSKSGRVVPVPEGQTIPRDQRVPIGEVEALMPEERADERTALLEGNDGSAAGGSGQRATDSAA
ncbi:hypothetical protein BD324DRAFT_650011 [Kockovaella imperatae]|uniref:SUR7/PalI family-domain-containing protein n=1 Tax=Kockovaella imperatae TaxID=4999 RepID=A0A1Y1UL04_9TREE|nr:hypothetical protein BD324DRAFT_650011 [Kockovaella imperatae]ORX38662.1 hypothetical protein BD324DRAFT_650011 [Kockovaella imperatae]